MTTYYFSRSSGNLSTEQVRTIIMTAGYEASDFTYEQKGTKEVWAKGDEVMSHSRLESTAAKLGIKGVTVSSNDESDRVPSSTRKALRALEATDYGITIGMSDETVQKLSAGGFSLYGFKAVQSSVGGGMPVVWFQSQDFGLQTQVTWAVQYQAYTSRSEIIPGGQIKGLSSYDIELGQQLAITTPQGTGTVGQGNTKRGIEILNETETEVTGGISEVVDGKPEPMCAFPLFGNGLDAIVPIQKVLLTFATKQVNTGTVIEKAYTQSLLVDLTSANKRNVKYDINRGWDWGGYGWGKLVAANSSVVPLLIEDGASFSDDAITLLA